MNDLPAPYAAPILPPPNPAISHRCAWCNADPLYQAYHDHEWGKPVFDNQHLFAMLCLEGMQAGLSWLTVLKKRADFYAAFDGFDPIKIALYDESKLHELLQNPRLIRNRRKLSAIINNARAYLRVSERQPFGEYLWAMSPNGLAYAPQVNHFASQADVPTRSPHAEAMAAQLKQDGFAFVGATICYALMEAVGMVYNHTLDCDLGHARIQPISI